MSTPHGDVDDAVRLVRVELSSTIEPGDLRVTDFVSTSAPSRRAIRCTPPLSQA